ncbi:peptidase inhibitor family I36 protein [Streptomyces sp. NPDC002755]|uniref:peptidase inhibitor family I36 protein n=1 Tax=Streptomyces sp. NPDC002884 TaxID=3154544 RepID=UPI00332C68F7
MIRRRLARTLVTASVLVGALATLNAGTAQADFSQCKAGQFCIWEHSSYQGMFASSQYDKPNVGSAMNDRTTSFWNRTDHLVCLCEHGNFQGVPFACVFPNSSSAAMESFNDRLTGFKHFR